MKRILATTDGSEASLKAVEVAGEIAGRLDADLLVLAVGAEAAAVTADEGLQEFARIEHVRGDAGTLQPIVWSEHVEAAERRAAAAGAKRIRVAVRSGDPTEQIIEQILEDRIDLVVVGSRGRGRLGGLLLGSVSQKLATNAPCSVLIVRPQG